MTTMTNTTEHSERSTRLQLLRTQLKNTNCKTPTNKELTRCLGNCLASTLLIATAKQLRTLGMLKY